MSVIAKVHVVTCGLMPNGALVRFNTAYDTDLAKAENEDVRFTQATPWGEGTMSLRQGVQEGSDWYLIFDEEPPADDAGTWAVKVRCHSITDFGGTSKMVELSTAYDQEGVPAGRLTLDTKHPPFHFKMSIDNPAASIQFAPGATYFMTMWNAREISMTNAIARARRAV